MLILSELKKQSLIIWVTSVILAEAAKRAGKASNNESLVTAVEGIKNFDTGDICAPITFSLADHKASEYWRRYKAHIKNIRFTPGAGWIKPLSCSRPMLAKELHSYY